MAKRLTPEERKRREEEKRLKAQEREKKRQEREEQKKLKEQELAEWDALYQYVRKNIMGYDENQSLSTSMVLRLKGLLNGTFMANNKAKSVANYSFAVILNAFKFCYSDIQKALRTNNYKDEQHKFNYILKIVEPKINDIYIRMKNAEKAKEEAKSAIENTEIITHIGVEYKPKEKKEDKFFDLW